MFRKMIEASLDRVVRSVLTDAVVREHARILKDMAESQDVRDAIADGVAARITPQSVALYVDHSEVACYLDTCEIAEHVDMQEVTNAVCENVTPDEIVDCLLQRVG